MANKKFSEFVLKTSTSDVSHIVGYNGAENVQITPANFLDTTGGPYLPLAGGLMVGDTTHNDNVKSIYGTSGDGLQIYHDGSDSYIVDVGTGGLILLANSDFAVKSFGTDEPFISAATNAFVKLYFDGSEKLATTSTGISVTGNGSFLATGQAIQLASASATGMYIGFRPNGTYAGAIGTAVQAAGVGTDSDMALDVAGANKIYLTTAEIERVNISAAGIFVTGNIGTSGSVIFNDNQGINFGNSNAKITGSSADGIKFFGTGSEKMRLTQAGRLGLGNSSPSTSLDILSANSAPIRMIRNVDNSNVAINYTDTAGVNWYAGKSGLNHFSIGIAANLSTNTLFNLTSSGSLGIGVVPKTSGSAFVNVQFGVAGNVIARKTELFPQAIYASNFYVNSSGQDKRIIEGEANRIFMNGAETRFNYAATGAADSTVTWIDSMRISEDGDVGIGTTTFNNFTNAKELIVKGDSTNTNSVVQVISNDNNSSLGMYSGASSTDDPLLVYQNDLRFGSTTDVGLGGYSERMRLDGTGNLLVGKTALNSSVAGAELRSNGQCVFTVSGDNPLDLNRLTNDGIIAIFRKAGAVVGSIFVNNFGTTYNTASDYRLKEDLQDFKGLDLVSKIPVYDYKWKADDSRSYGVMAHELEDVLPQAVTGEKDAEEMQSVDYSKIVPLLVKSIQELSAKLEALECQCEKK